MIDFKIYISFDIDQDFNPDSNADYYNRTHGKFTSFGENFIEIIDCLEGQPFSVFVRADDQINSLYGSYDYLISNNSNLIQQIKDRGGEINWHIHIYEFDGSDWIQIRDEKKMTATFLSNLKKVRSIKEINTDIVRIGECIMTNKLMNQFNDCGIRIDSTALPGRKRNDKEKYFDWSTSTNQSYFPSPNDYRIAGKPRQSLNVLEVPMNTLPVKASYDDRPYFRYFNLSFKTDPLFEHFDDYVRNHDSLVTITHPFEVLANGEHGLISYDLDVFKKNIKILEKRVLLAGKRPVFRKISDLID